MPVTVCPYCGYMIANPSQPCPACGADLSALTPPQPPVMASNSSRDRYRDDGGGSQGGMAVASLVLGIVCLVVTFIPCIGWLAIIPSIVGLVLGAVALKKAKNTRSPTGMAVTGLVLNIIALCIIILWVIIIGATVASTPRMMR